MPAPSSGGLALLQTLALLNRPRLASSSAGEPQVWNNWPAPRPGPMPTASTGCTTPRWSSSQRSPAGSGLHREPGQTLQRANGAMPAPGLPLASIAILRPTGSGHRRGHNPDHDRGRQRQRRLVHRLGGDIFGVGTWWPDGDEQSAHRFRLQAQPWRQTGCQPPPARPAADVVDGADAGVPQRRAGAGPRQPGGRSIPHLLSRVLLASLAWNEPPARAVAAHLSRRSNTLVLEDDPPLPWPFRLGS